MKPRKVYKVLAMDGGGICGVITCVMLERILEQFPDFLKDVDLIAGTSTGGIIAMGLANEFTPKYIKDMYVKNAKEIFDDSIWDDIFDFGGLAGAKYDNDGLKDLLEDEFDDMTLGDLKKKVLIPSFQLFNPEVGHWKPKFFHNFEDDGDNQVSVVDAAIRTSSAPTYFPIYQGYVDGGVVANNPSMCALAQIANVFKGVNIKRDIRIMSLGTGYYPQYIKTRSGDWGLGQWAKPIVKLMLNGLMDVANFQTKQLLGGNYMRFNVTTSEEYEMDEVEKEKIAEMIVEAHEADMTDVFKWVSKKWL